MAWTSRPGVVTSTHWLRPRLALPSRGEELGRRAVEGVGHRDRAVEPRDHPQPDHGSVPPRAVGRDVVAQVHLLAGRRGPGQRGGQRAGAQVERLPVAAPPSRGRAGRSRCRRRRRASTRPAARRAVRPSAAAASPEARRVRRARRGRAPRTGSPAGRSRRAASPRRSPGRRRAGDRRGSRCRRTPAPTRGRPASSWSGRSRDGRRREPRPAPRAPRWRPRVAQQPPRPEERTEPPGSPSVTSSSRRTPSRLVQTVPRSSEWPAARRGHWPTGLPPQLSSYDVCASAGPLAVLRALDQHGVGDVAGVESGELGDLVGVVGTALALVLRRRVGPPHEVVGDQSSSSSSGAARQPQRGDTGAGRGLSTLVLWILRPGFRDSGGNGENGWAVDVARFRST